MKVLNKSETTVTLTWRAPSDTREWQIQGYTIQILEKNSINTCPQELYTEDQTYTATGLTAEKAYMLSVAARDICRTGEYAELPEPLVLPGGMNSLLSILLPMRLIRLRVI